MQIKNDSDNKGPQDRPFKKRNIERDRGCIIALGTLWSIDRDTMVYDQIVEALGPDDLIVQARKDGNMRWSGLSDYLRRNK